MRATHSGGQEPRDIDRQPRRARSSSSPTYDGYVNVEQNQLCAVCELLLVQDILSLVSILTFVSVWTPPPFSRQPMSSIA